MRTKLSGWRILIPMVLAAGAASHAFAEETTPAGGQELSPAGQYKEGLPLGPWLLFPSIFAGAVYNTNVNQLATGDNAGTNLRVVPRFFGLYDGGMYKATAYGVLDGEFFNGNTIAATAGLSSSYQPLPDWVFNSFVNYTRETSIFNSALNFNNGAIGPPGAPPSNIPIILNPFGTTPTANPIAYNQFTGGATVTKVFNQAFASLGATAFYVAFDQPTGIPQPFQTSDNGASVWLSGRTGYHFAPGFYVFAEGNGIFQRFNNSLFNTDGYRIIGGLGADDPRSFFQGEIYGGYQAQQQLTQDVFGTASIPVVTPTGIPTDVNSAVFGGRVSYYPTRYWAFIASVDQTLGISTMLAPGVPEGTPSRVTTALLQTNYAIARDWWVGARFGYTQAFFFGISEQDNGWLAGASFNYAIWRNLLLTLDYQYTNLRSNVAFSSFAQNQFTAGLTYKY